MCTCSALREVTGGKVPWYYIEVPEPEPGAILVRQEPGEAPWISGCKLYGDFSHSIAALPPTNAGSDVWMVALTTDRLS